MWLVFNSFVYYILCQSNKPFKLRYLPKTKYQSITDILRDCRKSPKMAILAISHVIKSTTYKHQIYRFRVFRQSLRTHKLQAHLRISYFLTISQLFQALKKLSFVDVTCKIYEHGEKHTEKRNRTAERHFYGPVLLLAESKTFYLAAQFLREAFLCMADDFDAVVGIDEKVLKASRPEYYEIGYLLISFRGRFRTNNRQMFIHHFKFRCLMRQT